MRVIIAIALNSRYNIGMASCYFCGTGLSHGERIYRTTECPSCGKPIKICLNCEFYDPTAHYECREDIAEPVREKDQANFCDYFSASSAARPSEREIKHRQALEKIKNLFSD